MICVTPLRRRDEAVEAGDDHAHGESVLDGQRLTVHGDSEEWLALGEAVQRRTAGPAIDRGAEDLIRAWLDARALEQGKERRTKPARRADEVAADGVGDAHDGDVSLHHGHLEQFGIGDREGAAHHAVETEGPLLRGHLGHDDGGVDAIEVGVGGDEGRHARHRRLHARRQRGEDLRRAREHGRDT